MFIREARVAFDRENTTFGDLAENRSLPLFTESIISLLSSPTVHGAMIDLVSLMGRTFSQAAPAIYVRMPGIGWYVYSVLDRHQGGLEEAGRILGNHAFTFIPVQAGGRPPLIQHRIDMLITENTATKVILSINSGIHDSIFREWVNILTPAVVKLMDHEVLLHMAYRDGLTGLLNYRAFEEMLHAEHDRAKRYETGFSVMMIDVDWFKGINDSYGHQIGDVVLKSLADKVTQYVRKSDRVFRYGGEEFAVILPHTGAHKAAKLAERIRYMVEKTSFIAGLHITVSIGISEYKKGITLDELVRQADKGLYLAKKRGRNRVEAMKASREMR